MQKKKKKKGWVKIKHFHGKCDLIIHVHRLHTVVKRNGSGVRQPGLNSGAAWISCVWPWERHWTRVFPLHHSGKRGDNSTYLKSSAQLPACCTEGPSLTTSPDESPAISFPPSTPPLFSSYCLLPSNVNVISKNYLFSYDSPCKNQLFSVLLASASWVPRSSAQYIHVGL